MIPLIDIAISTRLASLFPEYAVRWMPSALGRKSAYTDFKSLAADGATTDRKGEAALTIFREQLLRSEVQNTPLRSRPGLDSYHYVTSPPDNECTHMVGERRFYHHAKYNISAWAYRQRDIDQICKSLEYAPIYDPVEVLIRDTPHIFHIEGSDPVYSHVAVDNDQTIRLYSLSLDFIVRDVYWLLQDNDRIVRTIDVNFYDIMTSGTPILL